MGERKKSLQERLYEHLRSVTKFDKNKSANMPAARHFNTPNHKVTHIECQIVEQIYQNPLEDKTTVFRKNRETFWIHKFRTITPEGINVMES